MITREYLESRIKEMTAARVKHQANVEANNGAIQFCQHLVAQLGEAEAEAAAEAEAENTATERGLATNGEAPAP